MSGNFLAKGTLLIPSGPSHDPDRKHLFVILNDACENGLQLLVPINSWVNSICDDGCILERGSHPFIVRKSYVQYRSARLEPASKLIAGVDEKMFEVREDFRTVDFLPIKYGVLRSIHTKRKIKKYARDIIGIKLPDL